MGKKRIRALRLSLSARPIFKRKEIYEKSI